ncbi:MAG: apolipoprotein N-acyltransferase [Sphingobacteriales bacterium]|jgi:apolipoprotein N-acyltransferase
MPYFDQTRKTRLFISLISGVILWLAWPPMKFTPLLFIAFLPLLYLEQNIAETGGKKLTFTKCLGVAFFVWNLLSTYWIWNASAFGMITAVLLNTMMMVLPFWLYTYIRQASGKTMGYIGLVSCWVAMEYFDLHWDLSWPWLILGNGFAALPKWVQWYEYTGVFGGTIWILVGNILIFEVYKIGLKLQMFEKGERLNYFKSSMFGLVLITLVWLLLPITESLRLEMINDRFESPVDVVVIQPNIDPYNDKFSGPMAEQVNRFIELSESKMDANTEYVIWPETALSSSLEESSLRNHGVVDTIQRMLQKYPNATLITGATTFRRYENEDNISSSARKYSDGSCCYDLYNTAVQIESSANLQFYHKSKLVPGVEKMPFPSVLGFLEPLAINLGGPTGSMGEQDHRTVFYSRSGLGVAPVICYESVYGEFVAEYVKNGAQLIAIITNDGWWGDTPGYKQHAFYASLRAIETRRSIARSANTGVSGFYTPTGELLQATDYWTEAVIKASIPLNSKITFYVEHGDYLARFLSILAVILVLVSFVRNKIDKGFIKK